MDEAQNGSSQIQHNSLSCIPVIAQLNTAGKMQQPCTILLVSCIQLQIFLSNVSKIFHRFSKIFENSLNTVLRL